MERSVWNSLKLACWLRHKRWGLLRCHAHTECRMICTRYAWLPCHCALAPDKNLLPLLSSELHWHSTVQSFCTEHNNHHSNAYAQHKPGNYLGADVSDAHKSRGLTMFHKALPWAISVSLPHLKASASFSWKCRPGHHGPGREKDKMDSMERLTLIHICHCCQLNLIVWSQLHVTGGWED